MMKFSQVAMCGISFCAKASVCVLLVCGVTGIFFQSTECKAALDEQLYICPRAASMGNAMSAYPVGTMAVHFNPAELIKLRGKHLDIGMVYPIIKLTSRFTAPDNYRGFMGYKNDPVINTESVADTLVLNIPFNGPASFDAIAAPANAGFSWSPPGADWTAGFAIYAPFAAGLEREGPAAYDGEALYMQRLVAAPAMAYKLSNTLSVGASVGFGTAALGVRTDARAPNDIVALTYLLGELTKNLDDVITLGLIPFPLFGGGIYPFDSVCRLTVDNLQDTGTFSYNLGLLWEPNDWFSAGICYQSESKTKLSGNYNIKYYENFQNVMDWLVANELLSLFSAALGLPTQGGLENQTGRCSVEFTFPQRVQGGIMIKPIKKLALMCDVDWVNWGSLDAINIKFDQDIQLMQLAGILGYAYGGENLVYKLYMKDTVNWHFGAEYQLLDWLAVRGGYEYRPTSVNYRYRDVMMPLDDLFVYSGGFGIKITRDADIDLGVSYIRAKNTEITQDDPSEHANLVDIAAVIYNPYSGLNIEEKMYAWIISAGINYRW